MLLGSNRSNQQRSPGLSGSNREEPDQPDNNEGTPSGGRNNGPKGRTPTQRPGPSEGRMHACMRGLVHVLNT